MLLESVSREEFKFTLHVAVKKFLQVAFRQLKWTKYKIFPIKCEECVAPLCVLLLKVRSVCHKCTCAASQPPIAYIRLPLFGAAGALSAHAHIPCWEGEA